LQTVDIFTADNYDRNECG